MTESPQNSPPQTSINLPELAHSVIPAATRELLGAASITGSEDSEAYERLLSQVAQSISPKDYLEWIWSKEIVDLHVEMARARRALVVRLVLARRQAVEYILRSTSSLGLSDVIIINDPSILGAWEVLEGEEKGLKALTRALSQLGLTTESIDDVAYHMALGEIERLQRQIDTPSRRRDELLREIEHRRDSLARRRRDATATIGRVIDAEFSPSGSGDAADAAEPEGSENWDIA